MKTKLKFDLDALPVLPNQTIPQGIVTIVSNRVDANISDLTGILTMRDLEKEIMTSIEEYVNSRNRNLLQRVFHLIQIWGGNSGRYVYVRREFNWQNIEPQYKQLVNVCLTLQNNSVESQNQLIEMIQNPQNHIFGLGLSFLTKHIHFWLRVNLSLSALPIYDKTLSERVMHEPQSIGGLRRYWQRMIHLSNERNIPLAILERRIYSGDEIV